MLPCTIHSEGSIKIDTIKHILSDLVYPSTEQKTSFYHGHVLGLRVQAALYGLRKLTYRSKTEIDSKAILKCAFNSVK